MKSIITIGLMCIMTSAFSQTQNKKVEIYKHYENGVLTEYDSTVTEGENLSPAFKERFDSMLKDGFNLSDQFPNGLDINERMAQMQLRMNEIQVNADQRFKQQMQETQSRMAQMQNRMSTMQQEMIEKMNRKLNESGNQRENDNKQDIPSTGTVQPENIQYY